MTNFNILKLEKLKSCHFVISNNVSHIKTKIWNLANIISPFSWMMTLLSILIIVLFARISQITLCKLGLNKNVTVELTLIPFRYIVVKLGSRSKVYLKSLIRDLDLELDSIIAMYPPTIELFLAE